MDELSRHVKSKDKNGPASCLSNAIRIHKTCQEILLEQDRAYLEAGCHDASEIKEGGCRT